MTQLPLQFDHPAHRVRALFQGHLIADSDRAVIVREDGERPTFFFPREDVEMAALTRGDASSYCGTKGDARCYTLSRDARIVERAAWSYEGPFEVAEQIRDLITFDPDIVAIEQDATQDSIWDAQAKRMSDYIRHTDSGSGRSQDAPWAPNVGRPGDELVEYDEDEDQPVPRP